MIIRFSVIIFISLLLNNLCFSLDKKNVQKRSVETLIYENIELGDISRDYTPNKRREFKETRNKKMVEKKIKEIEKNRKKREERNKIGDFGKIEYPVIKPEQKLNPKLQEEFDKTLKELSK